MTKIVKYELWIQNHQKLSSAIKMFTNRYIIDFDGKKITDIFRVFISWFDQDCGLDYADWQTGVQLLLTGESLKVLEALLFEFKNIEPLSEAEIWDILVNKMRLGNIPSQEKQLPLKKWVKEIIGVIEKKISDKKSGISNIDIDLKKVYVPHRFEEELKSLGLWEEALKYRKRYKIIIHPNGSADHIEIGPDEDEIKIKVDY